MIFDEDFSTPWEDAQRRAMAAYDLYESGQIEQAIDMLDEAISLNPDNADWYFNKGLALDVVNCFDQAIVQYQKALELAGNDLGILNALAVDYTRAGEFDRSIEVFEQIQSLDSNYEPCYCNRIITYTEMDRHEKAEEMFYLAQQIEPDCPLCFYNIGNSLYSRGYFERAIWCWEKTAQIEPSHPQINYRIGQGYWAVGNIGMTKRYFLEEILNDPSQLVVILDMAVVLLEEGDIAGAQEKLHRIIEVDSCNSAALFYLGESYLFAGDDKQAKKMYKQAIQVDNSIAGPRYRLAQISLENGDEELVRSLLKVELELDIENPQIYLSIGSMLLKVGMIEHAIHSFLQVSDCDPNNIKAYQYLSRALQLIGQYEDAAQFIEYGLSLNESDPALNLDAAILYLEAGMLGEAEKKLEKAREIWSSSDEVKKISLQIAEARRMKKIASISDIAGLDKE